MMNTCPPGMICLDNQNMLIIFVLIFGIIIIITKDKLNNDLDNNLKKSDKKNIEEKQLEINQKNRKIDSKQNLVVVNRDKELMENPLLPPHRRNYYIEGP